MIQEQRLRPADDADVERCFDDSCDAGGSGEWRGHRHKARTTGWTRRAAVSEAIVEERCVLCRMVHAIITQEVEAVGR